MSGAFSIREIHILNDLLDKYNEFRSIINFRLVYELEDETRIDFVLKQTDFPHLIGLHKLIDMPIIRRFNDKNKKSVSAKYLIQKIKQQKMITETEVKNSRYFHDIEDRYTNFSKDNLLTASYTDAIVDFDASLIGSSLLSDYILFESRDGGYNHLCVAKDCTGKRYAESFFHNPRDLYISGQKTVRIKKIEIYDAEGKLYLSDVLL